MLRSPPSRRRGLKFYFLPVDCAVVYRRLLRGGVDWNFFCRRCCGGTLCRLLRGGVDWNWQCKNFRQCRLCRLLRGGVDWNKEDGEPMFTLTGSPPSRRRGLKFKRFANLYTVFLVASFAEAWIEMYSTTLNGFCSSNVASFAEAWIEIMISFLVIFPGSRRLLRGGVDWNR